MIFGLIVGFMVLQVALAFKPTSTLVKLNRRFTLCPIKALDGRSSDARSTNVNESPLVDRALDSALDFLQDAEEEMNYEEDEFSMFEDIYSEAADFEIPYDLIAELEQKEADAEANRMPAASDLNKVAVSEAVTRWQMHDGDVGSAQVQVAIANERVKYLTKHLLANKHDMSAKRGLQAQVVARRKFLNYVYKHDQPTAVKMIQELGIRFRPPGRQWDKETRYGAYKNTKNKFVKDEFGVKRKLKK